MIKKVFCVFQCDGDQNEAFHKTCVELIKKFFFFFFCTIGNDLFCVFVSRLQISGHHETTVSWGSAAGSHCHSPTESFTGCENHPAHP